MTGRILVVEDEEAISDSVAYALESEGFRVDVAANGEDGLKATETDGYDLVLLDLMLPRLSGAEVCRRLRAGSAIPIIMLTAKNSELEVVLGLELGADDYVTKPFSLAELVGRVRALLRRRELDRDGGAPTVRRVGSLELDIARHTIRLDEEEVQLTPSEFKLLELLTREPERAFARADIMQHLWDSSYVGDQRACDTHVSNLRSKIEQDPGRPERLLTVRGVGYKLTAAL